MREQIEHPDIEWIELTGYPRQLQETEEYEDDIEDMLYEQKKEREMGW